ncbi:MAG: hypothetical protein Q8862_12620 [Bacteroidota bacterium]|nr:hypothetical protein [Bacteroidota bacterium]MDP4205083.1 hypothetical protein [Bacteroidota bacterium]
MACSHRFSDWLYLPPGLVHWEVNTLIVGTFNPEWDVNNYASWFYGRTDNNYFWEVLPAIYHSPSLRKPYNTGEWISFCEKNGIALTDLIYSIDDADEQNESHRKIIGGNHFSDSALIGNFKKITWTSIVEILRQRPSIHHVYLTRSASGIWARKWNVVEEYCKQQGITCNTLLTPSGNARFQYTKEMKQLYPALGNFIEAMWKQKWHSLKDYS